MDKLTLTTLRDYADLLDSPSPAPGGGSSSAYLGALGISLARMYAHLSFGKKKYEARCADDKERFQSCFEKLLPIREDFLKACDEDADLYNTVMSAFRLPRNTEEETEIREKAIENALIRATEEPLRLSSEAYRAMTLIRDMIPYGNKNVLADAIAGLEYLYTMIRCESLNIYANAASLHQSEKAAEYSSGISGLLNDAKVLLENVRKGESI